MSNYPYDINQYNNDPRSPFYDDGPECQECGEYLECEVDADEDGYYTVTTCLNTACLDSPHFKGDESE